ncbi:MAG: DMT family transporter [Eubacterium sp.]|nr:DMT family transporter [Eubacterium sp.]
MSRVKLSDRNIGIICIIASAFFFALMNLFVRMSGDVPFIEKTFFRNAVAAIVSGVLLLRDRKPTGLSKKTLPGLIMRAAFGTVGMWCNFYALGKLELSDASMLNKLSPFFALVFSVLILKETLTFFQGFCVFLAFVGTVFIVKPGFITMVASDTMWPALIGACGGMCAGLAYTFVRRLGEQGVAGPFIVFFFSAFSTAAAIPYCIVDGVMLTPYQLACLVCAGLAATGGQFTITQAYVKAPAREISIYDYTQLIFAAMLGFFVLGELPDGWSVIGYVVIVGASILLFLYNNGRIGKKSIITKSDSSI